MPFIRLRSWCSRCGCSWNAHTASLEVGISVYDCVASGDGRWQAQGGAWDKNGPNTPMGRGPWLLIDGVPSDQRGGDGEPLLKTAVFMAVLERDGVSANFSVVSGGQPAPHDHPMLDASGRCRDWNSEEIANGDHEAAGEDDDEDDNEDEDDEDANELPRPVPALAIALALALALVALALTLARGCG